MNIRFFNTHSGKLDEFQPLDPENKKISLYTCGPTVYDYAHIGNFRTFVFEDLMRRFLEMKGYGVRHVMNITDVDDKTIAGAVRENVSLREYTRRFETAFFEDLGALNIRPAGKCPRATEEIPGMIEMIQKLIAGGHAYESEGSVYYRVSTFGDYGNLSRKNLSKNITGARVDVDEYEKEEGADFVLWKAAKEGEPSWDSPWGKGRPGWHIECSEMSMKYLGEQIDLHAGGEDLIFPHHENEIAQSEAATGKKPFVRYWLHCKHLLVNGEKMSKSKGNFYTLRDLIQKGYDPMAIRYALICVHYRQQLNFTFEGLKEAGDAIRKLDDCYWQCLSLMGNDRSETQTGSDSVIRKAWLSIVEALEDDLNISEALARLWIGVKAINQILAERPVNQQELKESVRFFKCVDGLFGFDISRITEIPTEIQEARKQLFEFRREKKFTDADQIRATLKQSGWIAKDGRPGDPSTVKKARRVWDK